MIIEMCIRDRGDVLDFPQSVVEFFEGRLGTPYQGFPEELQKIILKGAKPITVLSLIHIQMCIRDRGGVIPEGSWVIAFVIAVLVNTYAQDVYKRQLLQMRTMKVTQKTCTLMRLLAHMLKKLVVLTSSLLQKTANQ